MLEVRALAVDGLAELCAAAAAAARVARFCNCRAFIPEERESVNVCMCVFCACKTKGTTCATECSTRAGIFVCKSKLSCV